MNQEGFRRRFEAKVRADNRASYCVVCFHFILGHIERIGGPGEILRFHRFVADVLHRRAVGNMDIGLSKTGDVFVLRQGKSPLSTRKWALHVLDEMRAYECAGAPLNRRDATIGVFPLASRDCCDCNGALFHARQCAIRAGNEGMYARVCGADKCYACEEEREPVSYTHLDVYKRQRRARAVPQRGAFHQHFQHGMRLRRSVRRSDFVSRRVPQAHAHRAPRRIHGERVDARTPVSYTHLDVYKRQARRFEPQ